MNGDFFVNESLNPRLLLSESQMVLILQMTLMKEINTKKTKETKNTKNINKQKSINVFSV